MSGGGAGGGSSREFPEKRDEERPEPSGDSTDVSPGGAERV